MFSIYNDDINPIGKAPRIATYLGGTLSDKKNLIPDTINPAIIKGGI